MLQKGRKKLHAQRREEEVRPPGATVKSKPRAKEREGEKISEGADRESRARAGGATLGELLGREAWQERAWLAAMAEQGRHAGRA